MPAGDGDRGTGFISRTDLAGGLLLGAGCLHLCGLGCIEAAAMAAMAQ